MKLHQNQLWRQGKALYRIVNLERLSVGYKKIDEAHAEGGVHHVATKKAFCRLIKGAVEVSSKKSIAGSVSADQAVSGEPVKKAQKKRSV